ncbi:multiple sugar transport system ATP-binding protein [Pseudorhizobium tarimense]|uniref:Multiple sugar transport system ATP-binding protein n=1 Tax=Pseudorhizobium tarimense TaxID=1079109 RepID=A0ABV2H510_9HYPH|nr:sn-glycerol-3-phosphate ABC transporter ATP-binding protein UgpC [Pseudorhizobium tarimense]MCJ8518742.1 sn-glycerol-3-phosphate ABC transporter ATP-binding protein UgpC [Pseudorhizobium tarimense]
MGQIKLTNVKKSFGAVDVLHDINLHIDDGELVVFVGPSGCGKSTLLRVIAGLEKVTGGSLEIDGRRVNDVTAAERGLAMVFQSYALYPHMTVRQNLAFGLENSKMPKAEIAERVGEAARMLEIEPYMDRRPGQLSGGQRQRVAIGRAIVRRPVAFLLDEPLSNLDAELRVSTRAELAALHARLSSTMIYVTHDQVEAMTLADRIVVMRAGRIEQVGTPLELYNMPANRFVAGFIGAPHMNFLRGDIVEHTPGTAILSLAGGYRIAVDPGTAPVTDGQKVTVGVRPQHLTVSRDTASPKVRLGLVEALGAETVVHGEIYGERLMAVLPGQQGYRPGDEIHLDLQAAPLHVFDEQDLRLFSTAGAKAKAPV